MQTTNQEQERLKAIQTMDEIIQAFNQVVGISEDERAADLNKFKSLINILESTTLFKGISGILLNKDSLVDDKYDQMLNELRAWVNKTNKRIYNKKQIIVRGIGFSLLSLLGGLSIYRFIEFIKENRSKNNDENAIENLEMNRNQIENAQIKNEEHEICNDNENKKDHKYKNLKTILHVINIPIYLFALITVILNLFISISVPLFLVSLVYSTLSIVLQIFECYYDCIKQVQISDSAIFEKKVEITKFDELKKKIPQVEQNRYVQAFDRSEKDAKEFIQQYVSDDRAWSSIHKDTRAINFARENYEKFKSAYKIYKAHQINVRTTIKENSPIPDTKDIKSKIKNLAK